MQKKLVLFLIPFLLYLESCSVMKHETAISNNIDFRNSIYVTGNVHITINQAEDSEIEKQVSQILSVKTKQLSSLKSDENYFDILTLNISINERSFIENFETRYSTFIYTYLKDSENNIVYENYIFKKSNKSISTSTYLNQCISLTCNKLKLFTYGKHK